MGDRGWRRLLAPSLLEWLLCALAWWLFAGGGSALLADGDTGWHIRTGEFILDHHIVPFRDLFSFSRPGEPWMAWEWLSDVLFASAFRWLGLKGVVLLAGTVLCAAALLVFRHMLWRGANVFVALTLTLLGVGASTIHYLARPHVFTLLLLAASLWLLDADRWRHSRRVWLLVPVTAVWTNLHGGFLALPASIALLAAGSAMEALVNGERALVWIRARRYTFLFAACSLATLINPYGFGLHRHIAGYLRSNWIRDAVQEFQSPSFRSESAAQFEVLLFAGLVAAGLLLRRRQVADALLILFWAHAALVSVRHVPLFVIVATPILGTEASRWWTRLASGRPAQSVLRIVDDLASDVAGSFRRIGPAAPCLFAALLFVNAPVRWPQDFPEMKFPVALVTRQEARLAGARVFTSDQWGDYLLYRFHPKQRVFIDGRSDFYGPSIGKLYLRAAYAHADWVDASARYRFDAVLAPTDWPLASVLRRDSAWRVVDHDKLAVLFVKGADRIDRSAVSVSSNTAHPVGATP